VVGKPRGDLFSPIYDGTTVYAASNGRVASYLATTGGRGWLTTPAATFGTSPALDPSGGSLVLSGSAGLEGARLGLDDLDQVAERQVDVR
jgi:hypothetical protein